MRDRGCLGACVLAAAWPWGSGLVALLVGEVLLAWRGSLPEWGSGRGSGEGVWTRCRVERCGLDWQCFVVAGVCVFDELLGVCNTVGVGVAGAGSRRPGGL